MAATPCGKPCAAGAPGPLMPLVRWPTRLGVTAAARMMSRPSSVKDALPIVASRLTTGLPRSERETVGCETPARNAMSKDVGFSCIDRSAFLDAAPSSGAIMHGPIGEGYWPGEM